MRRHLAFAPPALLATILASGCTGPKLDPGAPAPNYNPAAEREDYYPEPAPGSPTPVVVESQDGAKPLAGRYYGSLGRGVVEAFERLNAEKLKPAIDDSQTDEAADDAVALQSPDEVAEESAEPTDAAAPEEPD